MSDPNFDAALRAMRFIEDSKTIQSEFADVLADPQRAQQAHAWAGALRVRDQTLGQSRPDIEIYREAGRLARGGSGASSAARRLQQRSEPDSGGEISEAEILRYRRSAIRSIQKERGVLRDE